MQPDSDSFIYSYTDRRDKLGAQGRDLRQERAPKTPREQTAEFGNPEEGHQKRPPTLKVPSSQNFQSGILASIGQNKNDISGNCSGSLKEDFKEALTDNLFENRTQALLTELDPFSHSVRQTIQTTTTAEEEIKMMLLDKSKILIKELKNELIKCRYENNSLKNKNSELLEELQAVTREKIAGERRNKKRRDSQNDIDQEEINKNNTSQDIHSVCSLAHQNLLESRFILSSFD